MVTTLVKALKKMGYFDKLKSKKRMGMGQKAALKAADFKRGQKSTRKRTTMSDLAPKLKQYVEEAK